MSRYNRNVSDLRYERVYGEIPHRIRSEGRTYEGGHFLTYMDKNIDKFSHAAYRASQMTGKDVRYFPTTIDNPDRGAMVTFVGSRTDLSDWWRVFNGLCKGKHFDDALFRV